MEIYTGDDFIDLEMRESETIIVTESLNAIRDISIVNIWDKIEIDETYFAKIEPRGIFKIRYVLSEVYEY